MLFGAATSCKLYTGMLPSALWRVEGQEAGPGRSASWWAMPAAFAVVLMASYLPYLSLGAEVIGFLPGYLGERFNPSLARLITDLPHGADGHSEPAATLVLLLVLAIIGLVFVLRPAATPPDAIRRCIWPIGAFVLLAQILYPWFVIWVVPFVFLFVRPGRVGLRLDACTGCCSSAGS